MVVRKKIIVHLLNNNNLKFNLSDFDDLISYLIISIILGGRIGYMFYNFNYYISNPFDIFKVWEGEIILPGANR